MVIMTLDDIKSAIGIKPYFEDYDINGELIGVIYCADCLDILPKIPSRSVYLVVTDPPYQSLDVQVSVGTTTRLIGLDKFGGKRLASSNGKRWFSTIPTESLPLYFNQLQRVLIDCGALYVFADVKSGLDLFPFLNPANVIVWDKMTIGMGYSWRRQHEWIAYCPMEKHKLRSNSLSDIIKQPTVEQKNHPTEKPSEVISIILSNSSDEDSLILDPFLGSGTTAVAAKQLGRKYIGIEISEKYCSIAVQRLQQGILI